MAFLHLGPFDAPVQVQIMAFLHLGPFGTTVQLGNAAGGGVGYPFSQRRKRGLAQSLDG
jgi:hypothetical protein